MSECSKLAQKEYKTRYDWVRKVIHWEMCKTHTNSYETLTYTWITWSNRDQLQKKRKKKEKRTCKIVDFAVPADHRIKLKKCEKKDKYLDFARELKKLWNMKVTIIPIVIGAFGTITEGLLKGLEDLEVGGRVETIQTRALLRTARILRRVLETWAGLLSLKLQWKTIS